MPARIKVLPDERLLALRPELMAALRDAARELSGTAFPDIFDASMRSLLVERFDHVGAHEGTAWLLNAERTELIPQFNSGPHAEQFVGTFRQSVRAGMIGMVSATEQPVCENEVCRNARQDRSLDERLQLRTWAMLAVPFHYLGELRGVISCVQFLSAEPPPPGFSGEHLHSLQLTAGVLARLVEHRLLALCLGLDGLG